MTFIAVKDLPRKLPEFAVRRKRESPERVFVYTKIAGMRVSTSLDRKYRIGEVFVDIETRKFRIHVIPLVAGEPEKRSRTLSIAAALRAMGLGKDHEFRISLAVRQVSAVGIDSAHDTYYLETDRVPTLSELELQRTK